MSMRHRRTSGLIAGLAGGTLLLLSGCSTSSHGSEHPGGTQPAGGSRSGTPADASTVHITDYSDNDTARSSVVLTGAVGDYGQAQTVHGNGSTDPEHGDQLALRLTHGSFRLSIGDLDKRVVDAFTNFPPNRTTCSGRVQVSGPAAVVPGSGAGAYGRIAGTFELSITIDEVDQRSHCGPSSPFLSQAIVISGSGTVTL